MQNFALFSIPGRGWGLHECEGFGNHARDLGTCTASWSRSHAPRARDTSRMARMLSCPYDMLKRVLHPCHCLLAVTPTIFQRSASFQAPAS